MTKQSMAELVDYLRKRGYVELSPDPNDGRAKLVRLTDRGASVVEALIRISRRYERSCARAIGEDKWLQFRGLLAEVGGTMREVAEREQAPAAKRRAPDGSRGTARATA